MESRKQAEIAYGRGTAMNIISTQIRTIYSSALIRNESSRGISHLGIQEIKPRSLATEAVYYLNHLSIQRTEPSSLAAAAVDYINNL